MNRQEKIASLTDYLAKQKARLTSPVPSKRQGSEKSYKAFLELDIQKTTNKLEKLKMENPTK
jgi:hypothetical protein